MAFFHEGRQCFLGRGLAQHAGEDRAFFHDTLAHCLGLAALHQALGLDQRGQGLARQLPGLGLCHGIAFTGRHHAVDQAHLQRGFCHEGLAQQQGFSGAVITQHLGQKQAGCRFGAYAQVDEGQRECGVIAGIDQIAVQQQRGANTHCRTTDGSNQRLGEGRDFLQKTPHGRIDPHCTGG